MQKFEQIRDMIKSIQGKFPQSFPIIFRLIPVDGYNTGLGLGLLVSQPLHNPSGKV